jgi:serpin B
MTSATFDRRRFLAALAAAPVLAALLQACGDDDPGETTTGERRSTVARTTADPALAKAAADAVNLFGTDLYRRLAAAAPTENVVLSPTSIAIALAMTTAGAGGVTLTELLRVLRVTSAEDGSTDTDLHAGMNALDAALAARNRADVELSLANATWLHEPLDVEQAFLDVLAAQYGSGVELVDFESDPDGARVAINAWVAERTNDRIPELLAPDTIDELTRLVLVNAVYLDASWAEPFLRESTRDAPFTTAAGDTVDVPTMSRQAELPYASGDGWQAVELPYVGDELAMLLFLPEPEFLATFEEIFLVTDATQYLESRLVHLALPRRNTSSAVDIEVPLVALGLTTAFGDTADFSRITSEDPLQIARVVHQANITVGEDGTEAAAATAVVMGPTSAPPTDEPIALVFDHPFVFALRDRATGAVLFLGRVADPRS